MSDLIEKYVGRQIVIGEELHLVRGRLSGRPVMQIQAPSGILHEMSLQDFNVEVGLGRVMDRDPDWNPGRLPSDADRFEQEFRLAVIKKNNWLRKEGVGWNERIAILKQDFENDERFANRTKNFPTKRTIQMWQKSHRELGANALVDKRHLSGNRAKRHDAIFEEIVLDLLEERFLTSDRYTAKSLARMAKAKYLDRCREVGIVPSDHGEKVVRSLISKLPNKDVVIGRFGREEGSRKLLKAGRFEMVTSPFERVEIDSTQADIYVVIDDKGATARPNVCAAIDCATGVVVGMTVTLEAPNSLITVKTLKEAMTPTSDEFFDAHNIENRFQAFGRPHVVVSDHGSENSGMHVEGIVEAVGLEFRKTIPKRPEKKPYIERFMNTFNKFATELPGASQSQEMRNKTRVEKGQKESIIPFEAFVSLAQKWRFDIYAQTKRRRIQNPIKTKETPYEAWCRLSEEQLVPEPPTPQEIKQIFFAGEARRKLHHYGVEFQGLQYFGRGTGELIDKYGPGITLDVRYDPSDIRSILVKYEGEDTYWETPAKVPDLPAISFEELKRLRSSQADDDEENLSAARLWEGMTKDFHRKPRKATTKARTAKHEAIQRIRDKETAKRSSPTTAHMEEMIETAQRTSRPLHRPVNPAPVKRRKP